MEVWRLLNTGAADAYTNMALDEAILVAVGRRLVSQTLRIYAWDPPGLSLGFFQPFQEVDERACSEHGVTVVRRLTGGRAVLHAGDVTYSVALPAGHPLSSGGVVSTYLKLSEALAAGLKLLGVPAELSRPAKGAMRQAACFLVPSMHEVVVGGKKLLGSAQVRQGGSVLQHGSLPLDHRSEKIFSLLRFRGEEDREKAQVAYHRKATNLSSILGHVPTQEEICYSLKEGFKEVLKIDFMEVACPSAFELELGEVLRAKYASPSWTARV